jgi:PHD/YefM family antitoxin component YafN of YafNO toxin-antitoxin module
MERLFMNKEQYVVDDHGRRTAVILPAKVYDQMLEDIHDLAVVAERRKEGTITNEKADEKKWPLITSALKTP